jgi:uncharacterized protein
MRAPAAALLLLAAFAGTLVWLWKTGPRTLPRQPVPVTVALAPPLPPPEAALPPATPPLPALPTTTPPLPLPLQAASPAPVAPEIAAPAPTAPPLPIPQPAPKLRAMTTPAAPSPELIEQGKAGPLPRIAADGRRPWRAYARPFDRSDPRPRIAIVISNLGLSGAATEAAIQDLPGAVTLAFSPYAPDLGDDIPLARSAGHEVLLSLPMEPVDAGGEAGPQALKTSLTATQNLERLSWMLSRVAGYVGVTDTLGAHFAGSERDMRPILMEIKKRGLLFFDGNANREDVGLRLAQSLGVPVAANGRFIDTEASRDAIDGMLRAAEVEARRTGHSMAIGFPYPVTIERISLWARTLEAKGIALAPVSAMVPLQHSASAGAPGDG